MQRPFRTPVFFTPLTADRGIINFAFCDVNGVKNNALCVNVIKPGAELCWQVYAINQFVNSLQSDLGGMDIYYEHLCSPVAAQC